MPNSNSCPFCNMDRKRSTLATSATSCYVTEDNYPVTKGHMLIISDSCFSSLMELSPRTQRDMWDAAMFVAECLQESDHTITGFTIGANIGKSAGQTVDHAHIHVIPRRDGDTPNPRGGVRGVIQGKADYNDRE